MCPPQVLLGWEDAFQWIFLIRWAAISTQENKKWVPGFLKILMNWSRACWSNQRQTLFGARKDQYKLQRTQLHQHVNIWLRCSKRGDTDWQIEVSGPWTNSEKDQWCNSEVAWSPIRRLSKNYENLKTRHWSTVDISLLDTSRKQKTEDRTIKHFKLAYKKQNGPVFLQAQIRLMGINHQRNPRTKSSLYCTSFPLLYPSFNFNLSTLRGRLKRRVNQQHDPSSSHYLQRDTTTQCQHTLPSTSTHNTKYPSLKRKLGKVGATFVLISKSSVWCSKKLT